MSVVLTDRARRDMYQDGKVIATQHTVRVRHAGQPGVAMDLSDLIEVIEWVQMEGVPNRATWTGGSFRTMAFDWIVEVTP